MRKYPEDFKEKSIRRGILEMIVGLLLGMIFVCIGFGKGMSGFLWFGAVEMFLVSAGCIFYTHYIGKTFTWSRGGVLEIYNGEVVSYEAEPFCYRVKDLTQEQLVPIEIEPFTATRTLRIVVEGEILSYQLVCVATLVNMQRFYDSFLIPNGKGHLTPEEIIGRRVEEFLDANLCRIVSLYQGAEAAEHGREEYVRGETKRDAEQLLARVLSEYGLRCIKAFPTCKVEAVSIS